MKRLFALSAATLVLVAGPAPAAEIEFRPAYHKDARNRDVVAPNGDRAILFDAFGKIDWKGQARVHFKAFPLSNLSAAQIRDLASRKNMYGNVEVDYVAPLPEPYRSARFAFLSEDGTRSLRAVGLKGTVRYRLSRDSRRVSDIRFFGRMIGVPEPNNVSSGGMVALLTEGRYVTREILVRPPHPALKAAGSAAKPKPVKRRIRYRFSDSDAAYLFVQYEADTACEEGCCAFRYSLFREDPKTKALTPVASSLYGCDI